MNLKDYITEYVSSGKTRKTGHIDIEHNVEKITFDDILSYLAYNDFELLKPWGKTHCDGPYEIPQLEQIWYNTANKQEKTYMYGNWGGYGCREDTPWKYVIVSGEKDKDGRMNCLFISFTYKEEYIDVFKRVLYVKRREDHSKFYDIDKEPDRIKEILKDVLGIDNES